MSPTWLRVSSRGVNGAPFFVELDVLGLSLKFLGRYLVREWRKLFRHLVLLLLRDHDGMLLLTSGMETTLQEALKMGKRTTAELLEDAADLGVEVDEDWSYSELLAAVKEADVEPEDEPIEQPADPESAHPKERIVSPPGSPRRTFPFDELGRYIGR